MSTTKPGATHQPGVMDPNGLHKLGHRLWFGLVRALLRRLGGSRHGAAPDAAAWTASLARAGFTDARVVPAGWASLLVLIIAARRTR